MRLEDLAIAVRPRSGWQAMDLGFQIARQWWRPLWTVWFAVYLPAALLLHLLLHDKLWLATLLLWWFKPAFDRALMHVVSQAVFGAPPNLRDTLKAVRVWLKPGIVGALLWRRFDLARSMMLPIVQLEGQRGREARARRKVLGRRMRGYAVWLTVVCVHFEYIVLYSLGLVHVLLAPAAVDTDVDWMAWYQSLAAAWSWTDAALYALAVSVMEPFYVCAGFSLYLNRRAALEGWDIELALRRLGARLRSLAGAAAMVLLTTFTIAVPQPVDAASLTPREAAAEVLKAPEFREYREGKRWVYRGAQEQPADTRQRGANWLVELFRFLAEIAQVLGWVVAGLVVALLLHAALRWRAAHASTSGAAYVAPAALFGMDLRPETLPDDVAAAAAQLASEGKVREALSLLYRGALSRMVHADLVRLQASDTEGDCLRRARERLDRPTHHYFARLVAAWGQTAYGRQAAVPAEVLQLSREWARYFGPQRGAA